MTTKKNSDTIIQIMRKCLDTLEADMATLEEKVTLRVTQDVFRRLADGLAGIPQGPGSYSRVTNGNAEPQQSTVPRRKRSIATPTRKTNGTHPSTNAARKTAMEVAIQMSTEGKTFTMREYKARANVNSYVAQSTLKSAAKKGYIVVSGKGSMTCYKPTVVLNAELDALIASQNGQFTARSIADALNDNAYRIAVMLHSRKGKTVQFIPGSTRVLVRI